MPANKYSYAAHENTEPAGCIICTVSSLAVDIYILNNRIRKVGHSNNLQESMKAMEFWY